MVWALKEMKPVKTGPSHDSLDLIAANGDVGSQVMIVLYQRVLDWLGMPVKWALSVMVPVFREGQHHELQLLQSC